MKSKPEYIDDLDYEERIEAKIDDIENMVWHMLWFVICITIGIGASIVG